MWITFTFERATLTIKDDYIQEDEVGEWEYPFPNERGNSTAFGILEAWGQGGCGPSEGIADCYGKIIRLRVSKNRE